MDPTRVLQGLPSISLEQPLATRLTEAIQALDAHLNRMGAVIGSLHATGAANRPPASAGRGRSSGRDASQTATRQAVLELIEPEQDRPRLPAETLTDVFLSLFYGRTANPQKDSATVTVEQLVDLFRHGALTPNRQE